MTAPVKERRPEAAPAAPVRPVRLGPRDVTVERRRDGTIHLTSPHALAPYPAKLSERLEHWAATAPERVFLAQRDAAGGWRKLTYAETLEKVRRIGAALLQRELSPERPIAILSGNSIEHALMGLAAMYVGIPSAPISPAYSLISQDFGKLRSIIGLLTPGLVFAADGEPYRRAIEAVVPPGAEVVVGRNPLPGRPSTLLQTLLATPTTSAVDTAHAEVGPDTIVKFLFTSGSTGTPKAVINTQRMWCSNQAMILSQLAFFADDPPVLVDWSPWHHTAGGNHDFGIVLYNGGTLYIDEGKPVPGLDRNHGGEPARGRAQLGTSRCRKATRRCCPSCARMRSCETLSSGGSKCSGSRAPRCRNRCSTRCRSLRLPPAASASCS